MFFCPLVADIKDRGISLDCRGVGSSRKELVKETEGYAEGETVPKLSDGVSGLTKRT